MTTLNIKKIDLRAIYVISLDKRMVLTCNVCVM